MSLTEKWPISCFGSDNVIREEHKKDKDCISAQKVMSGDFSKTSKEIIHAVKIHGSAMQKDIIEALLLSEDCELEEAALLTGVDLDTILMYKKLFFRAEEIFISKIDLLDYIETGVSTYSEEGIEDSNLISFLLKRWAISLGKEFVIWRYRLKAVAYAPANLYTTIMKEAFFYHKEKSMGNEQISLGEYLRSTTSLLSSVKNSTSIREVSKDDAGLDLLDQLDIIVEDKAAPMLTLEEIQSGDFINNANAQETT